LGVSSVTTLFSASSRRYVGNNRSAFGEV
jgi:hypothetical protein